MQYKRNQVRRIFLFLTIVILFFPVPAGADLSLIKDSIIAYNLERHKKSLSDGSYRGEEGILRLGPEVCRSFGLKAPIDQDYLEAKALYKKADQLLKEVYRAMTTRKKVKVPGEHVIKVGKKAVEYNNTLRLARERMMSVRLKLSPKTDDRLNERLCSDLLEELLQESLNKTSYNLRDALGYFYNRCQGLDHGSWPLNPENVRFVNRVFREFTKKAPEGAKDRFDFDRSNMNGGLDPGSGWKHALGMSASRYITFLEPVLERHKGDRLILN